MSVLVRDEGFVADDLANVHFLALDALLEASDADFAGEQAVELAVDFPNDRDPAELAPWLGRVAVVRVAFPAMGDGRGLSIARRLRAMGYSGRLRAAGPMIVDQVRAARRVGFDEIELPEGVADRQPEALWKAAPAASYRARVFG